MNVFSYLELAKTEGTAETLRQTLRFPCTTSELLKCSLQIRGLLPNDVWPMHCLMEYFHTLLKELFLGKLQHQLVCILINSEAIKFMVLFYQWNPNFLSAGKLKGIHMFHMISILNLIMTKFLHSRDVYSVILLFPPRIVASIYTTINGHC